MNSCSLSVSADQYVPQSVMLSGSTGSTSATSSPSGTSCRPSRSSSPDTIFTITSESMAFEDEVAAVMVEVGDKAWLVVATQASRCERRTPLPPNDASPTCTPAPTLIPHQAPLESSAAPHISDDVLHLICVGLQLSEALKASRRQVTHLPPLSGCRNNPRLSTAAKCLEQTWWYHAIYMLVTWYNEI